MKSKVDKHSVELLYSMIKKKFTLKNRQAFNILPKPKQNENVLNRNEVRKSEIKVLIDKT